jgi:hypothetical protein
MQRILQIVLAAWFGSLLTICGIVAPSLFAALPDRHLAGQVAGHFFQVEAWLGLTLGGITLILFARHTVTWVTRLDYGLAITALLAPLMSEVGLRPLMNAARAADDMSRFGVLHGLSALLFAVACVATLLLIWRLSAPPALINRRAE